MTKRPPLMATMPAGTLLEADLAEETAEGMPLYDWHKRLCAWAMPAHAIATTAIHFKAHEGEVFNLSTFKFWFALFNEGLHAFFLIPRGKQELIGFSLQHEGGFQ